MCTLSVKNDVSIIIKAVELYTEFVKDIQQSVSHLTFTTQCLLQPLPTLFGQNSAAAGGNIMGVENQKENGILVVAIAMVETAEQYNLVYPKVKAWLQAVEEYACHMKDGRLDWTYLNYADASQDPLASYGTVNVEHLRSVSVKYDPGGVFQTLCPGGFKISNIKA